MKTVLRDKDLAILRDTLRRFPVVRAARVFGSRAIGSARRASDLDLAISAPEASALQWTELCEALENAPLIYELNIVRPEQTISQSLKDKIAREGITVYPDGDVPAPK